MDYLVLIAGFGGGLVRGIAGFLKYWLSYKNVPFKPYYFILVVILSGIVGMIIAAVFGGGPLFGFIFGYAGGDVIDNVYKIITKKPSLYLPQELESLKKG